MTTGERLIRNLCKETRDTIQTEAQTAKDALHDELTLKDLPTPLRRHAQRIVDLKRRLKVAQLSFKNSGYLVDDDGDICLEYRARQKSEAATWRERDRRYAQVKMVETAAIVDALSLTGAALQARLCTLQTDLQKI